jgi:hypothetical protein
MEWKYFNAQDQEIQKSTFCRKVMLMLFFWNFIGITLNHHQVRGLMVSSSQNCAKLEKELKNAIRSKRRGFLTNGVLLHHENARHHTAAATVETIQKLEFEIVPYPAYSPDLVPYYYHTFGSIKMRYVDADLQMMKRLNTWRDVTSRATENILRRRQQEVTNL